MRCARARARRFEDACRLAHEDRERRALARIGPAQRSRRARHPRERAGQLNHAGQGQPDPVRGHDHGVLPGVRQRRGDQPGRSLGQLRAERFPAARDPQLLAQRETSCPGLREF